ncbi:MAG: hypothetical protein K0B02_00420 [DPANN group archaeon]|nr:hypothetical protein [DPANN group archaeon]
MVRKTIKNNIKKQHADMIGSTSFILGVLIAIIAGLPLGNVIPSDAAAIILVVFGLIVGTLNINDSEITKFLIASMAFIVVGTSPITLLPIIGPTIGQILIYITYFVAPATLIVALEAIHEVVRS